MSTSIFCEYEDITRVQQLFSEDFHHSFEYDSIESILETLSNYKLSEVTDHAGMTLLHVAAMHNRLDLIRHLVAKGCHVNAQNNVGDTPLIYAVAYHHEDAAFALCEAGAKVWLANDKGYHPLTVIQCSSHIEELFRINRNILINLLETMGKSGVDAEFMKNILIYSGYSMHYTVYLRNIEVIKGLVEYGCNINSVDGYTGCTALHNAVSIGDCEMVKLLIESGANVNAINVNGKKPVALIRDEEFSHNLGALLDAGTNVYECDVYGSMQLSSALRYGVKDTIKTILNYNFNFSRRDDHGLTMMHYAASNKREGVAELFQGLQNFDANVQSVVSNETPLHVAADSANLKFLKILLKKGANVHYEDSYSCTALFAAIRHDSDLEERERCIELLLACGADVNHVNGYGLSVVEKVLEFRPVELLKPVLMHVAYLLASGQPVREESLRRIKNTELIRRWFDSFKVEFEEMKKPVIGGSKVTYWDILRDPVEKIFNYVKNNELRLNFEKEIAGRFPMKHKILVNKFRQAVKLYETIGAAENAICRFFPFEDLYSRRIVNLWIAKNLNTSKPNSEPN